MEIKIPEIGESVREALLAKWFKKSGDFVKRDEPLCEIETDKITLDLNAGASGILSISVAEGVTVSVGVEIGQIEESASAHETADNSPESRALPIYSEAPSSPSLRRQMREHNISSRELTGSGKEGRLTHEDLASRIDEKSKEPPSARPSQPMESTLFNIEQQTSIRKSGVQTPPAVSIKESAEHQMLVKSEDTLPYLSDREERRPMSPLRKRVAERLVAARQETAMLTTFNEVDMSKVNILRNNFREEFIKKYGIKLGFMPFFVKACSEALSEFPLVNASIDGEEIVLHNFFNIGVAIGGAKGLVVPVLRDADKLEFHEIDRSIISFSEKIKNNQLTISDLQGGTFTISNGGVYGSMLSTPILNPPQSAVLGMHAIQDRPVVRDGQIVIRAMMYLALSYDHRIIDGREAVGFLKKVKDYIEAADESLFQN
ncbi:MAG: 2-oxoglutarate dehydrogenase complex dihydrolipoyllysine-residue succinyltransferase [Desulfuromonadaceae bacterium]|nr:2-oxoglutarate dehydrogenase complex dihydrolipoyllysine-residue succinyltransferase [Desulfuromonadaceae bacterium]MDD2854597.1 2-oxoglutarate dehydrogenase complex dihydrolipoyllysine-residue succinyltransferase [Desulfuromonadaceae bacterium]